ncbi:hypothetical protein CR513_35795, partial [Mucuna pruriens]
PLSWDLINFQIWWVPLDLMIAIIYNGHNIFKLSHIEGSDPPRDDPKFEAWDDEDSLIMTWLCNSMTLEISRNYIYENLIKTYLMKKDSTTCYDIERKIFNSRHGTLSIIECYETLNGLWIKLD